MKINLLSFHTNSGNKLWLFFADITSDLTRVFISLLFLSAFFGGSLFGFSVLSNASIDSEVYNVFALGQTPKARKMTLDALRHIEKKEWKEAQSLIAESKNPLAAKIYHWLLLTNANDKDWNNQLFTSLSQFIHRNAEWPDVEKMKKRAEEVMPETLSSNEVIVWYEDFPPQSFNGMRRYIEALIINGKRDEAKETLARWWARSTLSRAQQKQIVKEYNAYLTPEAHKKRCDMLLYKGNYGNALAIAELLGNGYPELARARMILAKNRSTGLAKCINKVPDYLQNDPGLLYERLRWRRKRNFDKGALEILYKTPPAELIQNKKKWWAERHIIIRRLLEKGGYHQAYELAASHIQDEGFSYAQAQWLAGWMALCLIHRPTEAYERFSTLYVKVSTPVSKARAAYWAGRAADDIGQSVMAQN
ncbi:MAG: hypothetical protein KAJ40_00300, partial [Alphaproteobacteria bacterium]|nr:hypothetical protein [Alphaproteobacteria bacterium]